MSCNSCSNITLPVGATGQQGTNGTDGTDGNDGNDGLFGGYSLEFDFDSSLATNPPAGEIRFNNATPASVTEIYISTTGTGSIDATAFLDSFDDNADPGNHGFIRIFKEDSSSVFWMGKVTAVTTPGSYKTLAVTHISSGGTFADTNDAVVSFVANGSNANQKSGVIKNYSILDDGLNAQGTSYQLMQPLTIPASVFETQYNEVTIKGGYSGTRSKNVNYDEWYGLKIEVDGVDIIDPVGALGIGTFKSIYASPAGTFEMKLYFTGNNSKLRPVILNKEDSKIQIPQVTTDTITTSEVYAGNLIDSDVSYWNSRNVSLPEITCPSGLSGALTVKVWMKSSSTTIDTAHPTIGVSRVTPRFRVMNLHASFNKV